MHCCAAGFESILCVTQLDVYKKSAFDSLTAQDSLTAADPVRYLAQLSTAHIPGLLVDFENKHFFNAAQQLGC